MFLLAICDNGLHNEFDVTQTDQFQQIWQWNDRDYWISILFTFLFENGFSFWVKFKLWMKVEKITKSLHNNNKINNTFRFRCCPHFGIAFKSIVIFPKKDLFKFFKNNSHRIISDEWWMYYAQWNAYQNWNFLLNWICWFIYMLFIHSPDATCHFDCVRTPCIVTIAL